MIQALESLEDDIIGQLDVFEKDVIILDYLITAKQLISMMGDG